MADAMVMEQQAENFVNNNKAQLKWHHPLVAFRNFAIFGAVLVWILARILGASFGWKASSLKNRKMFHEIRANIQTQTRLSNGRQTN